MIRNPSTKAVFSSLLLAAASVAHASPDAFIDVDVSAGLDDNVTRAQENIDIEHDTFVSATGTFSMPLVKGRQGSLSGSAALGYQHFNDFEGLSNASLRLSLDYVFGFSSGFGAPWFALGGSYTLLEFDSFLRDSDVFTVSGTLGMRIDDLTKLRTALTFRSRESEGVAFDTSDVSLFVNLDWSLERAGVEFLRTATLYTTYKLQVGDVFSTASTATAFASGSPVSLALASSSIPKDQPDDVFGGIAYRLDATTHILTFGMNYKIDLTRAWDVSLRMLQSDADVGLEYEDLAITASYFHKFGIEL